MYHHSHLGSHAPSSTYRDMKGYIPEEGDTYDSMTWDADSHRDWVEDAADGGSEWRAFVDRAVAATAEAEERLEAWRSGARHRTPGRGGSAPVGDEPKERTTITVDAGVLQRTRERVGPRGLSAEVERLLRREL